ncbi:MAG: AAA family ATPase [Candidatus Poribacteria bacterium]|nr:AAA family ATPase [Candidatus Poribacteria bacterium]
MSEIKDTQQHPKVEIAVKNFGPIAEANIDLRPLTVFVGPSNTGKTYFATLMYALYGITGGFTPFPLQDLANSSLVSVLHQLQRKYLLSVSVEEKKAIRELLNATTEQLKKLITNRSPIKFSDIPQVLCDYLQSNLKNPKVIGDELNRCYDLKSVSDLIRFTSSTHYEMQVSLKVSSEDQEWWNFNMITTKSDLVVDGAINADLVLAPEDDPLWNSTYSDEFTDDTPDSRKRYYLPASRSGIIQSHRIMASSLMERAVRSNGSDIPTLSSVIVDFMKHLPIYEESKESDSTILAIAETLENNVLAGKIIAKPLLSGYPEFFYQPHGTKEEIHLNQTSSMVSELAPLVLFLRSGIKPGDTLIIEEPEAHLHPGAQADMAVILARLVRAGVRVIITTHSDWLLQEIGNLIRAGELGKAGKEVSDLPTSLQKEQVGIWHFQKDGKVEEIPYNRIDGVEPMEYLDVAEDLYNRSARLQNRLEEMKGDNERE